MDRLLATAKDQLPLLKAREAAVREAEARVALADREVWPKPAVGVQVRREGNPGPEGESYIVLGSVQLTIPTFQRNQGERARAGADAVVARSEREAAVTLLGADVAEARSRVDAAARRVKSYGADVVPEFEANLALLRRAFELGEIDLLELSIGRERFLRIQNDALGAWLDYFVAVADLERVVGSDLLPDQHAGKETPVSDPPIPLPPASKKIELSRRKLALLGGGVMALIGLAAGVTVLVEHRLHGHGEAGEHDDHDDHDEPGHGKGEKPGGHGDEHGEEGRVKLTPEAIANAGLEILTAGPGRVAVTLALPGEVTLNSEAMAHVSPRVPGAVREVKKQVGDAVKKGDVLAVLDSRELADLQREVAATRERLSLAQANFDRVDKLYQEKITSEKDYLAAKQALAEAKIDHRSAAQKLGAATGPGARGSGYTLVAPLDGTIIEKHVSIGEVLREDTQAFIVADLSVLWVNATVYAKDLPLVREGQAAWIRAEGIGTPARGTVSYLARVVGEQNRAATARVVLPNPGSAWRPGLFATVDVAVDETDAKVVVSDDAVQRLEGKEVVFVQEGEAFEARPVKIGRRGAGPAGPDGKSAAVVEIEQGVAVGERYVAKNSFILKAELGKSEAGHEH